MAVQQWIKLYIGEDTYRASHRSSLQRFVFALTVIALTILHCCADYAVCSLTGVALIRNYIFKIALRSISAHALTVLALTILHCCANYSCASQDLLLRFVAADVHPIIIMRFALTVLALTILHCCANWSCANQVQPEDSNPTGRPKLNWEQRVREYSS